MKNRVSLRFFSLGFLATCILFSHAIASEWTWHGYFDWRYQNGTRPNSSSFDAYSLSLSPRVVISDELDLYANLLFRHGARISALRSNSTSSLSNSSSGEILLTDSYLTYRRCDWLAVRVGKFTTPIGLWNTAQYASPTYPTVQEPGQRSVYTRGANEIINRFGQGVWALGTYKMLQYDLFVINGRGSGRDSADDNENKGVGGRAKIRIPCPMLDNLSLTYSRYQDHNSTATLGGVLFKDHVNMYSMELGFRDGGANLEYAQGERAGKNTEAFYTIVQYTVFDRITPFVKFDYLSPDLNASLNITRVIGGGIAFNLVPKEIYTAVLKLQADQFIAASDDPAKNYNLYSIGIAAGF